MEISPLTTNIAARPLIPSRKREGTLLLHLHTLFASSAEILKEFAVRRQDVGGVVGFQSFFVSRQGTPESKELRVLAGRLGHDLQRLAVAFTLDLFRFALRLCTDDGRLT